MKRYSNLYFKLCSIENLELAFRKARRNKTITPHIKKFENNLEQELLKLKHELETFTYKPEKLIRFIVNDPKTRTIHASAFKDRVVHHALINIIQPIFEKSFIHDSFANQINKGTHKAVLRFEYFKGKVSKNYKLVKKPFTNNSIQGYVFKADIKHYFETVDHDILLNIIKRRIKDENILWLIKLIIKHFNPNKGMPLGNLTSQFFANVFLNELDYYIKNKLKAEYYIRYVDDFVILHQNKNLLEAYLIKIKKYLTTLKLELHPDKSKIIPLQKGLSFLGYRIFGKYKLLRKRNIKYFHKKLNEKFDLYNQNILTKQDFKNSLQGWIGYSMWANTYRLRTNVIKKVNDLA